MKINLQIIEKETNSFDFPAVKIIAYGTNRVVRSIFYSAKAGLLLDFKNNERVTFSLDRVSGDIYISVCDIDSFSAGFKITSNGFAGGLSALPVNLREYVSEGDVFEILQEPIHNKGIDWYKLNKV